MFTDKAVMISHNWVLISSDSKPEMLYILSLLNSTVTQYVLWKLLSNKNEKSFQIGIKTIKEFCRIPRIAETNQKIKDEIIAETERLIKLEKSTFSDCVDFSGILQQKFDSVEIKDEKLVISYENKCKIFPISGDVSLAKQLLNENVFLVMDESGVGNIRELKKLPVVDFRLQQQIKDYIDDMVFALYFNVELSEIGFTNREKINRACMKHKYYAIINGGHDD